MFREKVLYDLSEDSWPIPEPDGKIHFQKAHLHKGSHVSRQAGTILLKTNKTTKESSGIRVIINTKTNAWHKLKVRASLHKGDKAFILAQNLHIIYEKTKAKLSLKEELIPRIYFFVEKRYTEYVLYFRALSNETILGLLFYSKDIEYEVGITDFVCSVFDTLDTDSFMPGILSDFPHINLLNKGISKDLHRFGLGKYPEKVELIHLYGQSIIVSLYILTILDKPWFYFNDLQFTPDVQTSILEFEVPDIHKDNYLKYLKNNVKISINILPISNYLSNIKQTGIAGLIELRTDCKVLVYHTDFHNFYPCIKIMSNMYDIETSQN